MPIVSIRLRYTLLQTFSKQYFTLFIMLLTNCVIVVVVVVALLFYVHGKHLRSCRDGQLT